MSKINGNGESGAGISRTVQRNLVFTVMAMLAAAVSLGMIACSESGPETVEATLVAPPGVPPKVDRPAAHVIVHLEAREEVMEIAPGVRYQVWTFNGSVPGPMIRVRLGDTVEIRLKNRSENSMLHNIDLHSVNGPGGGAEATNVAPGEEKAFRFKALAPGLFVYHCAAGIVADHIGNGMYGAILVERPGGGTQATREYYVGQSEYYVGSEAAADGTYPQDGRALIAEEPSYVVFNGNTKGLVGDDQLEAETGDTVRLYVANGGPNLISSFHVIGEIFDRAYEFGSLSNLPLSDIQTIVIPPGGAGIVDFEVDVPGDYKLVDHAISRVSKGGLGILHVTGEGDPEVFQDLGAATPEPTTEPAETATATSEPPAATSTAGTGATPATASAGETITIDLKDNVFEPKDVTVPAGATVTFTLENLGALPHNMHIADAGGSFDGGAVSAPELILPGGNGTLTWSAPGAPGTYAFRCDVHPVEMTGTITVQ